MRNWLFGLPGRILYEQSPWYRREWWACSWLRSSPVSPTSAGPEPSMPFEHPCTAKASFLERPSNHYQALRLTFSAICTKSDAAPLSDLSRIRIRPDTWLQIKGRKKSARHPAALSFVHWLPRYASTVIYRCVALLQLLYRWQHQSRKLWIPICSV
jgi:hypothetical protein